jgi:hypothetical protein
MLQAAAADPSILFSDVNPKLTVFRAFLRLWNCERSKVPTEPPPSAEQMSLLDYKLAAITPRARQAYLLVAVEEFSTADVALILETDPAEAEALVDLAAVEIARQLTTNVLIIEDEPMIAIDLKNLVLSLGHRVCATARTHKDAVEAFRKYYPGLVLADVLLADGSSGLDAANEILNSFECR